MEGGVTHMGRTEQACVCILCVLREGSVSPNTMYHWCLCVVILGSVCCFLELQTLAKAIWCCVFQMFICSFYLLGLAT